MLNEGIDRRYVHDGLIIHAAWMQAIDRHEPVATCPLCHSSMYATKPREGRRIDYTAECPNPSCCHELVAPAGKVLSKRSSHRGSS